MKIDCLQATLLKDGATRALLGISRRNPTRWPQRHRSCLMTVRGGGVPRDSCREEEWLTNSGALKTRAGRENFRSQTACRSKLSHESPGENKLVGISYPSSCGNNHRDALPATSHRLRSSSSRARRTAFTSETMEYGFCSQPSGIAGLARSSKCWS